MRILVKDTLGHIQWLQVSEETDYVQINSSGEILFYTEFGVFSLIRRIGEWASLLEAEGFLRVDRGTIINLKKAWLFDPEFRVLRLHSVQSKVHIPIAERSLVNLKEAMRRKGNC
ncbi:LytTR family transcriptional regulator DNA-binding domain-containing protein [Cohnella panacarvi]|uniref:LytTR family transcriptional regulator DNA-binding domain-containing protein n=1 Tax=Cohnella panacarvi TaxID=400776 RepID=UPI00047E6098|nr:LytTR family transcriptional regulator DNA-binding domain-containing protein [Cohnella panacarvi]